jgi:hypothetical protein
VTLHDATPADSTAVQSERFYTLQEAARILGIPLYALRRAVKRGLIPTFVLNGRRYVKLSDVVAFMAGQSN